MLNVPTRLKQDVTALMDHGSESVEVRRNRVKQLRVETRRASEVKALEEAATSVDLSVHPTVLLSVAPMEERNRTVLRDLHDGLQETSRSAVLEARRAQSGKELNGLLKQIFAHWKTEPNWILKGAGRGVPTVQVPTIQQLMNALHDERMHFEEVTNSGNIQPMLQALARQLQWLIEQLGTTKERSELYEHQYKLLLLRYAQQSQTLLEMKDKNRDLDIQLCEQIKALGAERARSADYQRETNGQLNALRDKLRDALETNMQLNLQIERGGPPPSRNRSRSSAVGLPPLRNSTPSKTTKGGGAVPSSMGSSSESPRLTAASGTPMESSTPSNAFGGGEFAESGSMAVQEKEEFLHTISQLRQDLAGAEERAESLKEESEMLSQKLKSEKEVTEAAVRAGKMEATCLQQLLQTVRDGHVQQLRRVEKSVADARATIVAHEGTIQALQERLKEGSARMLALQSLLLSGPSVQTLLVDTATVNPLDAKGATESLAELSERINVFADHLASITASDFGPMQAKVLKSLAPTDAPQDEDHTSEMVVETAAEGGGALSSAPVFPTELPASTSLPQQSAPASPTSPFPSSQSRKKIFNAVAVQTDPIASMPLSIRPLSGEVERITIPTPTHNTQTTRMSSARSESSELCAFADEMHNSVASPIAVRRKPSNSSTTSFTAAPTTGSKPGSFRKTPQGGPSSSSKEGAKGTDDKRKKSLDGFTEPIAVSSGGGGGGDSATPPFPFPSDTALSPEASPRQSPTRPMPATSAQAPSGSRPEGGGGAGGRLKTVAKATGKIATAVAKVERYPTDSGKDATTVSPQPQLASPVSSRVRSDANVYPSMSGGATEDNTSRLTDSLDKMGALRKQLNAVSDELYQLKQVAEKQKKSLADAQQELMDKEKLHSKDAVKLASLAEQSENDKKKFDKVNERCLTLLQEISALREEVHDAKDAKDQLEGDLQSKVADLQRVIDKFRRSDERVAMLQRETQFVDTCDRVMRCLASVEATAACPICLKRLCCPVLLTPCGHSFCEECFVQLQSQRNLVLPGDAMHALESFNSYKKAVTAHKEAVATFQAQYLAGLGDDEAKVPPPPKKPSGYQSKSTFVKCITGCNLYCPDCTKQQVTGYVTQARLEEIAWKVAYVESTMQEIYELSKQRLQAASGGV